jgi:hypothetical protein
MVDASTLGHPLLTSKPGFVYTALGQDQDHFIAHDSSVYEADGGAKKPIFRNVFSRANGHPFICVSKRGNRLEPREFRESSDEGGDGTDGYLIIGEDIWDSKDDFDLLPEAWMRQTLRGPVPHPKMKAFFPTRLNFNEFGECSEVKPLKWWGWFMKAPLLFDPTDLPS